MPLGMKVIIPIKKSFETKWKLKRGFQSPYQHQPNNPIKVVNGD